MNKIKVPLRGRSQSLAQLNWLLRPTPTRRARLISSTKNGE
jgi:hypothetical protein